MWAKTALLSAILAASAFVAPASAQRAHEHAGQQAWTMPAQYRGGGGQQDLRSIREVVEELRSQYGGEYVSHRLEQGGSPVYVVRWRMPDGQIRDIRVSASR
ncbi:MAG: hypothetical protein KA153_01565 [Hyphomonadaceae bacterium]|nr:hypothetical protein [Hyphomonadaceae bacterium]